MTPALRVALAVLALVLTEPAAAATAAAEAFGAAARHFEQGDYALALERFRAAERAGLESAALRYNIGVCEYRTGAFAAAASSFRRLAAEYPALEPLAQYNLGLSLVRQARYPPAAAAFERARETGDETVARLADTMLERLARRGHIRQSASGQRRWSAYAGFGIGYDDNVALLDDSGISSGITNDSGFAAFSGRAEFAPGIPGNAVIDASLYAVRYPDVSGFDQDVARIEVLWPVTAGDWRIDLGPRYSHSTLDGDGYERRVGLAADARRLLGAGRFLRIRVVHEEIGELDPDFNFIAGSHQVAAVRYAQELDTARLSLQYEFIVDDRDGEQISATRNRLGAGLRWRSGDDWSFGVDLSYRASRFDDTLPTRDEDLFEAGFTLSRELAAGWEVSGSYRWSNNDSDVDAFAYRRHRLLLFVDRAF